ncbi:hypothetical protein D3C87_1610030 [compost metagenome]
MATGHHGRALGVSSGTAGENIADAVDADGATGFFAPAHEQVTGLPVQVGQGQATNTALGGGTQLRKVHQRLPETFAVDQRRAVLQLGCRHYRVVHFISPVRRSGPGSGS